MTHPTPPADSGVDPTDKAKDRGGSASRRLTPFWRWFGIGARAVHIVAVVLLGAAVMGAAPRMSMTVIGVLLLTSGVALLALDTWKTPQHLREFAGAAMVGKLLVVVWMLRDPVYGEAGFWLIVLWSVVFAHAPASFRHRRVDAWRG
ncbi:MAG: hypothetical protein WBA53_16955 [Burkholderiaceae bacterium]